jgi:hypothetical protein
VGSAAAGAARGPEKQADGTAYQQKAQAVVNGRVLEAEAFGKKRKHQARRKAEIAGGKYTAGLWIEWTATKQAHGKLLRKI